MPRAGACFSLILFSCFAPAAPRPDPATELAALERQWSSAYLRHDAAAIAKLLADDFIGTDGRGMLSTKQQEIDEARVPAPGTPDPPFVILDENISDIRVRAYGNTAVVTALSTEKVRLKSGAASTLRYRRTTVWIKDEHSWRCVSFHGSRIADPR